VDIKSIVYSKYKTRELTGTKAMDILGLKGNTFYKLVKEHTSKKCAICAGKRRTILNII